MIHATLGLRIRCLVASRLRFDLLLVLPALATFVIFGALETSPASADNRVYDQPEAVKPLSPGQQIPTAVVHSVRGKPIDLETAIGEGGALLVFYRGGW